MSRLPIRYAYDPLKAGELAACLIRSAGGSLPLVKLLKLMYLADRASIVETGYPITGDAVVGMDLGPVLSETYDRLKPDRNDLPYVRSQPLNVTLSSAPPENGKLSDYEVELADSTFRSFGKMTGAQLATYLHRHAPEWKPTRGTSVLIDPASILRAAGRNDREIDAIAAEAAYFRAVERARAAS